MIAEQRADTGMALARFIAWLLGSPLTGPERHELYQTRNRWLREDRRARTRRVDR